MITNDKALIFSESTFVAAIDSNAIEWIQQSCWRQEEWLRPSYVPGLRSLPLWTSHVLIEPKLLGRSIQNDRQVGLIRYLKGLWHKLWDSTLDLTQHKEHCLGDGVRLQLPQAMRRGNRMAHEPQPSSDNGDDDD